MQVRHNGVLMFRLEGTTKWVTEPMARLFYGVQFLKHYDIVNLDKVYAPEVCYA
jgi:hypothetical protein